MKVFVDLDKVERAELAPGITVRFMLQDNLTTGLVEVAPNAVMPRHRHEHEQSGLVLQRAVTFTTGGNTKAIRQRENYLMPPYVEFGLIGSDELPAFPGIFDGREVPTIDRSTSDKGALT